MLILLLLLFIFIGLFLRLTTVKNELYAPKSYMLNLNTRPSLSIHY
ncbi:hypothetical protein EMA8858_03039 [Emticicia aquatica]|uniref:Uncharacterized protein n=1 Tax=Emticicia aquatica TaxID=1681835 RepID=A0ABN8EYS2_9BACT|nr:hypothetical protein EMA8858_03039 [Emticicia aquatica]